MSNTAGLTVRFTLEAKKRGGEWVNVEYIRIIPLTDKYNQPHRPVEPADKVRFAKQYEAWKKGLEEPEKGQPLKAWPGISPAEVNVLAQAGLHTVEALAAATEQQVGADGPYLALRDNARKYLELSSSTSNLKALQDADALKALEIEDLKEQLQAAQAQLREVGQDSEPKEPQRRGPGRPRKNETAEG